MIENAYYWKHYLNKLNMYTKFPSQNQQCTSYKLSQRSNRLGKLQLTLQFCETQIKKCTFGKRLLRNCLSLPELIDDFSIYCCLSQIFSLQKPFWRTSKCKEKSYYFCYLLLLKWKVTKILERQESIKQLTKTTQHAKWNVKSLRIISVCLQIGNPSNFCILKQRSD